MPGVPRWSPGGCLLKPAAFLLRCHLACARVPRSRPAAQGSAHTAFLDSTRKTPWRAPADMHFPYGPPLDVCISRMDRPLDSVACAADWSQEPHNSYTRTHAVHTRHSHTWHTRTQTHTHTHKHTHTHTHTHTHYTRPRAWRYAFPYALSPQAPCTWARPSHSTCARGLCICPMSGP